MTEDRRPKILLCATMWWPLSARLAIAFLRHGCRVSAICPPGHQLRFVTGIESIYLYRGLDSIGSLERAIEEMQPDFIAPCDDGVVWQLHELHARVPKLRPLIENSLGSKDAYPVIRGRGDFLQAAMKLDIRVPLTKIVHSEKDLEGWCVNAPAVLKLDGTWGGIGVVIARSHAEAVEAFGLLSQPMGPGLAWKRLLINRDPIALWSSRRREPQRITIQQFIAGRPANTMFACWRGEVLAMVTVVVLAAQGATGAATVVRVVRNEEIEHAARTLAKSFELSGLHGLDFMLEDGTDDAYLIELNPRSTQLGHLRVLGQGDLAGAISAQLRGGASQAATAHDVAENETIAFFPQAFNWNAKSEYLRSGYHDVPWEEPALIRELLRDIWPERQWLTRLYHQFRVPKIPEEVKF